MPRSSLDGIVAGDRRLRRQVFEAKRTAKHEARNMLRIVPRISRSKYSPNECQRSGKR